jgi:hypothetical protein
MDVNDNACFLNACGAFPPECFVVFVDQCLRHNPPHSNNKDAAP